ncbi:hypothetical protein H0H93_006970 [Arthromyces matolae]|nr:hypothetical protein H0H93_006970 [Arthromyces matolae]
MDDICHPNFHGRGSETANIAYAQDSQARHVVMKAILSGSGEARILEFLHGQGMPSSIDDFNYVMPIIDYLPCEGHWIAIMPRWGLYPLRPSCVVVQEVFHFIHCLLKGLTYLHERRISHGDIKLDNVLVNHVDTDTFDWSNELRKSLRSRSKLVYALFDFDGATMFPRSTPLEKCRLPSRVSFDTFYDQVPADTFQGEFDFNPFAFDVGMMGVMFCKEFQHLTPAAPMLAPLLDKMTTRNVDERFKASEALHFFEQYVVPLTTKAQLSAWILDSKHEYVPYDYYDRWQGLEPGFIKQWSTFREPPVPGYIQLLRYMCEYRLVYFSISYLRRAFSFVHHLVFRTHR